MKHFACERMFHGKSITEEFTVTDYSVQVGLDGDDKPHIDAILAHYAGVPGRTG